MTSPDLNIASSVAFHSLMIAESDTADLVQVQAEIAADRLAGLVPLMDPLSVPSVPAGLLPAIHSGSCYSGWLERVSTSILPVPG